MGSDFDQAVALFDEGNRLREQRRWDEAFVAFTRALSIDPSLGEAWLNLGYLHERQDRLPEAIDAYQRAIALKPDLPAGHFNLGNVYQKTNQWEAARRAYAKVLALQPDQAAAWLNLGNCYRLENRLDDAFAAYHRALELQPNYAGAHVNLGNAYRGLNDLDSALACYHRALVLDPTLAKAHLNEGLALLVAGRLREGWPKCEYRWAVEPGRVPRAFAQPQWSGDASLEGKTILLHAEQGLGDTLQYVRYVPLVAARGATILLEVQPPLQELLRGLPQIQSLHGSGDELPAFDLQCALQSLPLAFGTELDTIPKFDRYLEAPPTRRAHWRNELGDAGRPRIGVVWAGNPGHPNDANRSLSFAQFRPIVADFPAARFFALQKELKDSDRAACATVSELTLLSPRLGDFADTAAIVEQLDLVITVDTSMAHLAGALGKPVWVLVPFSPDYRWLLERDDSPWYPSMRLFRQPKIGDWDGPVQEVRRALNQLFAPF